MLAMIHGLTTNVSFLQTKNLHYTTQYQYIRSTYPERRRE